MSEEKIKEILEVLTEILDDPTVPKNIKLKINALINVLKENTDLSLRQNRALDILEEISEDNNIQPYTRTQLWNVASMLESL